VFARKDESVVKRGECCQPHPSRNIHLQSITLLALVSDCQCARRLKQPDVPTWRLRQSKTVNPPGPYLCKPCVEAAEKYLLLSGHQDNYLAVGLARDVYRVAAYIL
jgi:hypothetical protein